MSAVTFASGDNRCLDRPACGQPARVDLYCDRLKLRCYGGGDEETVLPLIDTEAVVAELRGIPARSSARRYCSAQRRPNRDRWT
jgi:hypothetical protein